MTRLEAQSLLAIYISKASSDTRWTPAVLNTLLDHANREVWLRALRLDQSRFVTEKGWTWTANAASYDLTGANQLNEEHYRILNVFHTQATGAVSATNLPLGQIRPLPANELIDVHLGGKQPAGIYSTIFYWAIEGDTMRMAPIPGSDLYLRVVYLPQAPTLVADANLLLSLPTDLTKGRLVAHHELVVLRAAKRALAARFEKATELASLLADAEQNFLDDLSSGRQQQTSDYIQDPYSADEAAWG